MHRSIAAKALLPALVWATAAAEVNESGRKPNVVFILADDLGWRDTGVYGSRFYETPNIDALAQRGMMFTDAYAAAAICSPTRASILTGLHPARIGITAAAGHLARAVLKKSLRPVGRPNQPALAAESVTRLGLEYYTLAEALGTAGYATGHFGKWHLGREPHHPLAQGFDVDIPGWHGPSPGGGYFAPWSFWKGHGSLGEHIEDRMAIEAAKFMATNRDRPFFLNYWCFSVHAPIEGKPELVSKYRKSADPANPQRNPINAAMIETLDDAVGALTRSIDDLGIAENTVIVLFSDNGGIVHRFDGGTAVTSNAPLRSGKSSIYEGGVREPLIVVWPGIVEAGSASDAIVQSVDFYPTVLEMTGTPARSDLRFDGTSIVPALRGEPFERETIFTHIPNYTAATRQRPSTSVRKGDWKLIRFYCEGPDQTDRFELYNLGEDMGETRDLSDFEPARVSELNRLIDQFLEDTEAVIPTANSRFVPGTEPFPVPQAGDRD